MSIMPQIVGVWCKEEGHEVNYSIFTGSEKIRDLSQDEPDMVFISSFTYTAQLAYALSGYYRSRGIVTILGGPHARSYPDDACLYFDYVLGLTDKELIKVLLKDACHQKPVGLFLSSPLQPDSIPGVRERWKFIEKVHENLPVLKMVPMIGSFGCPFKCDFCVDSEFPYRALAPEQIKEDLSFLAKKIIHPRVSWYDPNFGVNFNQIIEVIESATQPGSIEFIAECSLSLLKEENVRRLKKCGFKMIMPGIESWFSYGKKSRTIEVTGMDKVHQVAEQINMIQRYIPQVQTNFIVGLDCDTGEEPFSLTKRFIDLAPGAYPSYALLSAFGQCPASNQKYQRENRIIPFPFHMMRSVHTMNVLPLNYSWEELNKRFLDLLRYSFSARAIHNRFKVNYERAPRWITLLLSLTIGGRGKERSLSNSLNKLKTDLDFQRFINRETDKVPAFMINNVKNDLGLLWKWLPNKSLSYNPNVFAKVPLIAHTDG